jgi:hypothetical protein
LSYINVIFKKVSSSFFDKLYCHNFSKNITSVITSPPFIAKAENYSKTNNTVNCESLHASSQNLKLKQQRSLSPLLLNLFVWNIIFDFRLSGVVMGGQKKGGQKNTYIKIGTYIFETYISTIYYKCF